MIPFAADEREAQIRALLPLVKRIARRIRRLVPSSDFDDLIGDGSIGLIRAVDNFDPKRGPSLVAYARHLILGTMLNGIRRMDPVSERTRRVVRDGENVKYRIALDRGVVPRDDEMERIAPGFARASVAAHRHQPLSLDAPLPDGERFASDWNGDPGTIVTRRDEHAWLRRGIARLPDRQRALMVKHYISEEPLCEIGKRMRVSPQRASQLHLAALARLRKHFNVAAH